MKIVEIFPNAVHLNKMLECREIDIVEKMVEVSDALMFSSAEIEVVFLRESQGCAILVYIYKGDKWT